MTRTLLTLALLFPSTALACSVFSVSDAQGTRMGRNLDWYPDTDGQVWVEPATADTYGVVFFGTDGNGFAQDGVNEHGLAFAGATIPTIELEAQPDLSDAPWWLLMDVLRTSRDVDEAMVMIDGYDLSAYAPVFANGHLLFTDAEGASMVMEGDTFVSSEADHQVMTNFCLSQPELGYYPCPRYDLLEGELSAGESFSDAELIELIYEARGSAWGGFTVYSQLYDLEAMHVTLWWESDFEHPIHIDLLDALDEAPPSREMADLWQEAVEEAEVDVPYLEPEDTGLDESVGGCAHLGLVGWPVGLVLLGIRRRRS